MFTYKDYQSALDVQSACNGSGVAHSLAAMYAKALRSGLSTGEANNHPIIRMFTHQLAFLAGLEPRSPNFGEDYNECLRRSKPEPMEPFMDAGDLAE